MVVVGLDVATSVRALEIAELFEGVYAAVGWHPNYADGYSSDALVRFREMLAHPKAVAAGEIGLDFYRDHSAKDRQQSALEDQLDLAQSAAKPVIFHCRNAYDELLSTLERRPPHPYLFHCFTGDESAAKRIQALGGLFGAGGAITFRKSDNLRSIITQISIDSLVLETDSPLMSPEPFRGKPNKPANLPLIHNALAGCLKVPADACGAATTANARRFFAV